MFKVEKAKNVSVRKQYISIFVCWLAYTSAILSRYSYSANIALIEKDYGVTHASAGLVMTFFAVTYGVVQFIHGILCKHYPRRYIVFFSLIISAFINLSLFFGVPFYMIKYLWLINAVCQSVLWPMLLQIISENVSEKVMKKAILAMGTTTSLGTLLIYGISAVFSDFNYRITFLVGSVVIAVVAVIWFILYEPGNFLKTGVKEPEKVGEKKTAGLGIFIFPVMLLVLFSITTNFLKDGFQTWVPVIFKNIKPDLPDSFSLLLTLILPLFGMFGVTVAVMFNKKIKKAIPLCVVFLLLIAFFNSVVLVSQKSLIITAISFAFLELLLHGCSCAIVSIFPLSVRQKVSTGSIAGILNGAAYVGTAASAYLLGRIADGYGWNAVFLTLLCSVCTALVLGAVYLLISVKKTDLNP